MSPQIGETVYIFEFNGARKIKSDAQVAMNKNSDHVQKFFLRDGCEDGTANSYFFKLLELSETSRAGKLIFGLQLNIRQGQQSQNNVIVENKVEHFHRHCCNEANFRDV